MTKILFISRAYPPIVGGIENQNFELGEWLSKIADVKKIVNTKGKKFLPLFAPYALIKAFFYIKEYDIVLLGDGTLAIIGWIIKIFSNKSVASVIHGLDVNYGSNSLGVWCEKFLIFLYQKFWVGIFLKKMDRFFAVGNETVAILQKNGFSKNKIVFIPNGIDTEKYFKHHAREELEKILGQKLENKEVILTSGRLAKRKGVAWFCENVMTKLQDNIIYIVAGDGADRKNIEKTIQKNNLSSQVKMLGYVTDATRDILFNTGDLFVQPNIKVPGDMEGFGISVIEAASCGIPVIASDLEGLKDAIKDGQNGFLVESGNAQAWIEKINDLLSNNDLRKSFGEKATQFVIENYSWEKISRRYLEEIERTISN